MEPWKKVHDLDKNFYSNSNPKKSFEDNNDILYMLAALEKMDENKISKTEIISNIKKVDDKKNISNKDFENEHCESEEKSNQNQQEFQNEKIQENQSQSSLEKNEKFLDKIYNLMNLKREKEKRKQINTTPGYSIDANNKTQIPDSIIRTLLTKFLNQRFLIQDSDLNSRSSSLKENAGFYKWDNKNIAIHLKTNQVQQILTDKYGYDYEAGENNSIPLSFYFDLSGSMAIYTSLLSVIAIELLKKKIKVLIGFNQTVHYQINKINDDMSVQDFVDILKDASKYFNNNKEKNAKIDIKEIKCNIDKYLFDKKAEKCVVFSDFDSLKEVIKLSDYCQVYYFCFESYFEMYELNKFKGFFYQVKNANDIVEGLIKINEANFEALKYIENNEKVKKLLRGK